MKRTLVSAALGLMALNAVAGDACSDNFTTEGNMLLGRTFKTWAVLPGVRADDAFTRAQQFTVANGMTVLSADRAAGVISAQQSATMVSGRGAPMGILVLPEGNGTRVAMHFGTLAGQMSPADAVKRHFCLTIAAAGSGPAQAEGNNNNNNNNNNGTGNAPAPRRALHGFATPTDVQQQRLAKELQKVVPNGRVRAIMLDARRAIDDFVSKVACMMDGGRSAMNALAVPGQNLKMWLGWGPIGRTTYHDKGACMTVNRIHGWEAPANNAITFEVVYVADDSGETATFKHEAVRQPDGVWLFNK